MSESSDCQACGNNDPIFGCMATKCYKEESKKNKDKTTVRKVSKDATVEVFMFNQKKEKST